MKRTTLLLTALLLIIVGGLAAADALLTDLSVPQTFVKNPPETTPDPKTPLVIDMPPTETPGGTTVANGPDVLKVLSNLRFTYQKTNEPSLLKKIVSDDSNVQTYALLLEGDRAGFIAWTESSRVKIHFLALKEALHSAFSPEVQDLIDETQREEGRPTRNLLTFRDPGINEERLVFVRVRQELYEFHVAEGNDDAIFELIEFLTQ